MEKRKLKDHLKLALRITLLFRNAHKAIKDSLIEQIGRVNLLR